MLINIHVTTNAKEAEVTKLDEINFEIRVDERAEDGLANGRLLEILSRYFKVPKSKIRIVRGSKSRNKVVEVITGEL
ncbi:MAG TPA: DUF167 domain-containing protein [Nitrososphaerales archaeon]|nr:DUF167 domain-containing protein [Nitrososphaerales archaeon]